MNPQDNKAFVERYLTVVSRDKRAATMDQYISEEPLKQHIAFFDAAFPGYTLDADDMIAEGDRVAVRATFRGTHQGELMGIPPTGKAVAMDLIIIYRIQDGKIVDHWMQTDTMGLLQQLGAVPVPAH